MHCTLLHCTVLCVLCTVHYCTVLYWPVSEIGKFTSVDHCRYHEHGDHVYDHHDIVHHARIGFKVQNMSHITAAQ